MPKKPKSYSQRKAEKRGNTRQESNKFYEEKRKRDPRLLEAKKIRSSKRWQDLRAKKLRQNPLCSDPFKNHLKAKIPVLARQVNHIKPLADFPELAFSMQNLASICTSCHAGVSMLERKGKDTTYLFKK